jgi:hypothetical protein
MIIMEKLRVQDADDAVSGLMALQRALSAELGKVEKLTEDSKSFVTFADQEEEPFSVEECNQIRTALLSALASVDELFAWVRLFAEKDAEGNELDSVESLPEVNIAMRN